MRNFKIAAVAAVCLSVGTSLACNGNREAMPLAATGYRPCGFLKGNFDGLALSSDALFTLEDEGRTIVKRTRSDLSEVVRRTISTEERQWYGPTTLSPDGQWLAVSTPQETLLLAAQDLGMVSSLGPSAAAIAFSSDSRRLATTAHPGSDQARPRSADSSIRLWRLPEGQLERQVDLPVAGPIRRFITFAPGNERLIVGPSAPVLAVSAATGDVSLLGYRGFFGLSSQGLAVVGPDESSLVQFVDLIDGHRVQEQQVGLLDSDQVAFSPDGRFVVLSTPAAFKVLDTSNGFRQLGDSSGVGLDDHVVFATDGRAFVVYEDGETGLFCLE